MADELAAVVMAAGIGTRMKSATPKHLHPILGRRMVDWVVDAARDAGVERMVVVASPQTSDLLEGVEVAVQEEPLGTGDAVRCARSALEGFGGDVLEEVARLRRCDDYEPLDARPARRIDHPVDHAPPEQRMQVLRRRALHARADPSGHHNCCERFRHVREKWLGRQDSNLGSRDQNPLPYRLATPQGAYHATAAQGRGDRARRGQR